MAEYVEEHGYDEYHNKGAQKASQPPPRQTADTSNSIHPADAWEVSDVEAVSTDEIVKELADHGIETGETAFRNRIEDLDSATTLSEYWEAEYEIKVTGYDQDFIWMAAQKLWERWAPNVPNRERIYRNAGRVPRGRTEIEDFRDDETLAF